MDLTRKEIEEAADILEGDGYPFSASLILRLMDRVEKAESELREIKRQMINDSIRY
jgi:hypothetical protein